jgi:hypothetical protein
LEVSLHFQSGQNIIFQIVLILKGGGRVGGKGGGGGRGEKWTKPCMHICIIKEKGKKINKKIIFKTVHNKSAYNT